MIDGKFYKTQKYGIVKFKQDLVLKMDENDYRMSMIDEHGALIHLPLTDFISVPVLKPSNWIPQTTRNRKMLQRSREKAQGIVKINLKFTPNEASKLAKVLTKLDDGTHTSLKELIISYLDRADH